jgi:uncharacterized membrane protein YvlD (DUF360 family)
MYRVRRLIVRFVVVWIIEALSLLAMDSLVPGIRLIGSSTVPTLSVALAAALVLGIMNTLVRPILLLLTLPINTLTLGASTFAVNVLMLAITAYLLPGLTIATLGSAILGALVLAAANTILTRLTPLDDEDSFFEFVVERLSRRQHIRGTDEPGRGLAMLEIDGLSHSRIAHAAEIGLMPTVRELLREGYVLSRVDCGLPSQTSACQAGIMYGDNDDIPAFRWYDKERGKMMVSNNFRDAAEMNARFAKGHGLLRGGSSINNLMAGDAEKTLLTLSVLSDSREDLTRRRQEDLYLFWLNPYLFVRSLVLMGWDILIELGQAIRQRIRNVQPRINRLSKGYPILRALTNVFLRDLGTYMVALDVIRGVPAIYTTYVGYDEVAHHAGPDTRDALNTLRALDHQIRRVREVIAHKATRPYDMIILSDHGQSFGATFKQRYGGTLAQFIDSATRPETTVTDIHAAQPGMGYAAALAAELQSVEQNVAGRIGQAAMGRARQALQNRLERNAPPPARMDAHVTVCASGNLANVYFSLRGGKIGLNELNAAHPGLIDALVTHPGIGFVVTYADDGTPLALGKGGARDLRTGIVTGSDPLQPYGDPVLRSMQLLRLAEFAHAGDLIVNSTLYPDGTLAAFEELVGSHGGLGGEQTDAFLLHPADMFVPATSNSADVFVLLNARRGSPAELPRPRPQPVEVDSWALSTLLAGARDWRTWIPRAVRSLALDRSAYREAAHDELATGSALIILLMSLVIQGWVSAPAQPIQQIAVRGIGWFLAVLVAHTAGRILRGTGEFTGTLRAMAYAESTRIVLLLTLVTPIGPLFTLVASMLIFLATWVALQEALHLSGWRVALIPIVGLVIVVITTGVAGRILGGVQLTIEGVLLQLGIGAGQ